MSIQCLNLRSNNQKCCPSCTVVKPLEFFGNFVKQFLFPLFPDDQGVNCLASVLTSRYCNLTFNWVIYVITDSMHYNHVPLSDQTTPCYLFRPVL